jgi:uncharacterized membrane protein
MQAAFILSFLSNLVLALISLAVLPERVAIHFGFGGIPDGWASSLASTLMVIGTDAFLFIALYFSPRLVDRVPAKWFNLPNRDYWLVPERRQRAVRMISGCVWLFGTALFLFMFVIGLLTLRANLTDPVHLNETAFLSALVVFLAYTIYWTIALVRAFRIPKEDNLATKSVREARRR